MKEYTERHDQEHFSAAETSATHDLSAPALHPAAGLTPSIALALQRSAGNTAVTRLVARISRGRRPPAPGPVLLRKAEADGADESAMRASGSDTLHKTVLRLGSGGVAVTILQSMLNDLGEPLQVDGRFGQRTRTAVVAFQKSRTLKVDGVVGPHTWSELDRSSGVAEREPDSPAIANGALDDAESGGASAAFATGDLGFSEESVAEDEIQAGRHANANTLSAPKAKGSAETKPKSRKGAAKNHTNVDPDADQASSWFDEREPFLPKVVGAIFFHTNSAALDDSDRKELDKLVDLIVSQQLTPLNPDDRPVVAIVGNADPRSTTRKGGNPRLSQDRAWAVYKYLESRLDSGAPTIWRGRIAFEPYGVGVDTSLKQFGLDFMRSAVLVRVRGDKLKPGRRRAPNVKKAKARARDVLQKHKQRFDRPREWDRLWHACQDSTTDDGFLHNLDSEFQKVVAKNTPSKPWSTKEVTNFFKRNTVTKHLMMEAGPDATDEEVIGALRNIEANADEAINTMYRNQAEDEAIPHDLYAFNKNNRREQLIREVAELTDHENSFYYKWGNTRSK